MTDPELAHKTYIEPITPEFVEAVIKKERPDSLLPTLGGQTALNTAVALAESGVLNKYHVKMLGASLAAIRKAENRDKFKAAMQKAGVDLPRSGIARSKKEALELIGDTGLPAIIRPSFTLGGSGGNVAYNLEEYDRFVDWGLAVSPASEILVEESLLGWKEFELEVMRNRKDNVVIVCSIENLDPMGIHTGDSITVAPIQTLTDKEYQYMRDAAIRVIRAIGVDTGGSNIQFAVHPGTGRMVIIEMNPRVSRSSALASKATGFPIAKIAAKLAVGYTLDEIPNDITEKTPACFEPTIDYVVTKWPRFTFEKYPETESELTVQMKSVGEAMAIGRTFKESFQKAIRSMEIGRYSLSNEYLPKNVTDQTLLEKLRSNCWDKMWYIAEAFRRGHTAEQLNRLTTIDPWFLMHISEIVDYEKVIDRSFRKSGKPEKDVVLSAKKMGFSDHYLGSFCKMDEEKFRKFRIKNDIVPVFKKVDTCGAEFEASTPYFYSSYEKESEVGPCSRRKIMILGGGPNRIGQGIEFDYCCVHASFALREVDVESIMVNCNPETVSTDYDTSDRLYFEPLTFEDVMSIFEAEKPDGVIVQFGGQTPLKLAEAMERAGVPIVGTSPDSIGLAEDRKRFARLLEKLKLRQAPSGTATSYESAKKAARSLGFPLMVRPSFVLGGRAMKIVHDEEDFKESFRSAFIASPDHPVLIDKFLEDAIEVDVDAISDRTRVIVGGVMEHIEEAGVHSGDSACSLPPVSLGNDVVNEIKRQTVLLAKALGVCGLINIQFAVKDGDVYILEVNPRASRTVPFVSKAIGIPLAKMAAKVMAGKTLKALGFTEEIVPKHIAVKEAVFPFIKFPGVDTLLGPEMKSTGEVMGISDDFGLAFYKSQEAAGSSLPDSGTVFISVKDEDKAEGVKVGRELFDLGFKLVATQNTCIELVKNNVPSEYVRKVQHGRPNIVDSIVNNKVDLIVNTTAGGQSIRDSFSIRRSALDKGVSYITTIRGAEAAVKAIQSRRKGRLGVKPIQAYYCKK
jgi:carbamoyl-phosphate synthase large subunit